TSLPSSLTQTSSTASSATPFRYVRVCRNGFGASRANIAVDYVLAKKGTGPSDPLAPTCTFSASPASIPSGQSTTLAWTTANASAVSINQGVGTVSAAGSRTLTPTANITYTLTATGSGTKTCTASVAVATPTSSCTFNGATVAHGASVPAYQTASVPVGSTCTSQSRVCTNGTLSGTYTFSTCTVGTDTTPPTVSLGAAPAGTISGTVTLSATASDNVAVAGVQFKVDGANVGAEDTTGPSYSASWNTTSVANGSHSITAVARDAAGNINTTAPRTVTVSNTQLGSLPAVVTTCPQLLLWINRPETPCELNFNGYTQVDNPNGFRQKDPRVALVDASGQNAHYTDGLMFNGAIQNVSSGDNLTIQAAAGDQIVLSDDVLWKGKTIKISGNGTMQHPILVRPEHPGKVILTGDSSLWLTGSHIIVNDLKFYGPNATASDKPAGVEAVSPSTSHLIVVRLGTGTVLNPNNCDWCILNKVVIDGYNTAQSLWDNQDITYITHPTGRNNTIANSTLRHKKNLGHFLTTGQDNGNNESTHVLNNLFFDGPDLENIIATPINESKGAFVQIGNASGYRAYDIFEGNTFQNSMVNGGNFAIKESDIIIRNNIFKNTPNSPFIIRTANRVLVDSNIFDGQGAISNTGRGMGGITMSGRGHWIIRNTFQNLPSQFKNLRPIVIDDGMYESLTGPVSVVSGCPTHVPPGLDHNCYYARSQNVVIADNTFTNVDWSHFAPIYMGIFRAPNSLDLDRHPVSSTLLPRNIWILHNTFTFPTGKTLADAVYFEPPHPPDAYDGNNIVIASVAQNSNLASASSPGLVERFLTWLTNLFAGI
ncbi:MAG: chondroitinase-B domain-containing protein, partial [bacterium]|nr:chondroitinase-B domain-containing protein [bacterium]